MTIGRAHVDEEGRRNGGPGAGQLAGAHERSEHGKPCRG
jgi:hypothetical protein